MVIHLINLWTFKSKSTTFKRLLTLKRKNWFKDKNPSPKTLNPKTKVVPLLILKRANGLKTSYGDTFDKLLDFFDEKYHFLETFDTKTQKLVSKTKTLNRKP